MKKDQQLQIFKKKKKKRERERERQMEDEKEVNKDSNRIIKDYDHNNNKDNIFIHTAEKCAFYKSLEQKQKPKKATSWKYRIQRYRNMHNSKVFCI